MDNSGLNTDGVKVLTGTASDAATAVTQKGSEVVNSVAHATTNAAGSALVGIDFGTGSWALAAVAFVILVLVARGNALKARGLGWRFATAAVGAVGFYYSWWAGLATASLALGFRWARRSRHPLAYTLAGAALVGAIGTKVLLWADPNSWHEQERHLPANLGSLAQTLSGYGFLALAAAAFLLLLVIGWKARAFLAGRKANRRAYWDANAGGMLYKGPGLDPKRSFDSTVTVAKTREQGDRCAYWDIGCVATDPDHVFFQGDHIYPHSKGGATVPDNCQALCPKCNGGKSDLLDHEARAKLAKVLPHRR